MTDTNELTLAQWQPLDPACAVLIDIRDETDTAYGAIPAPG